jgi:hypothetical protein
MVVEEMPGRDPNDEEIFKAQDNFNGGGEFIGRDHLE